LTSPKNVRKQVLLISSYFTTIPGGGSGGRVCKLKIRLTQPNFVELGLGLSLAILSSLKQFHVSHNNYPVTPDLSQVRVNINEDGTLPTIFEFTCYGGSYQSTKMLLKNKTVNKPITEVCGPVQTRVAFTQMPGIFEVDEANKKIIQWPEYWLSLKFGAPTSEILTSFFTTYNLTPTWQNAHGIVAGASRVRRT
jgi:hypothetical protein